MTTEVPREAAEGEPAVTVELQAVVREQDGSPVPNEVVYFRCKTSHEPNMRQCGSAITDSTGKATLRVPLFVTDTYSFEGAYNGSPHHSSSSWKVDYDPFVAKIRMLSESLSQETEKRKRAEDDRDIVIRGDDLITTLLEEELEHPQKDWTNIPRTRPLDP